MTDDEVDVLLSGVEDSQGQVLYEGKQELDIIIHLHVVYYCILLKLCCPLKFFSFSCRFRENGYVSLKALSTELINNYARVLVFMSILKQITLRPT